MAKIPPRLKVWIDARKRYKLTDAQIQMARELGMTPKSLGKMSFSKDQPWKMPLSEYIEHLYFKRFKRERPEEVLSIEARAIKLANKKSVPTREAQHDQA